MLFSLMLGMWSFITASSSIYRKRGKKVGRKGTGLGCLQIASIRIISQVGYVLTLRRLDGFLSPFNHYVKQIMSHKLKLG